MSFVEGASPPVYVTNATPHDLVADAMMDRGICRIRVTENGKGKVQRELDELKQVLGDLLQEKLPKVYTVAETQKGGSVIEILVHVHLTPESAMKLVEGRTGQKHDWQEKNSHGRMWTSWTTNYRIEEHGVLCP